MIRHSSETCFAVILMGRPQTGGDEHVTYNTLANSKVMDCRIPMFAKQIGCDNMQCWARQYHDNIIAYTIIASERTSYAPYDPSFIQFLNNNHPSPCAKDSRR